MKVRWYTIGLIFFVCIPLQSKAEYFLHPQKISTDSLPPIKNWFQSIKGMKIPIKSKEKTERHIDATPLPIDAFPQENTKSILPHYGFFKPKGNRSIPKIGYWEINEYYDEN